LHDEHDKALVYWRQNHRQYPPEWVWDKYYFNLLRKSFESRHELRTWSEARKKQLRVRPLRYGHRHDRRQVSSLHHFFEILQLIVIVG
jgi:hypothetical protein